MNKGTTHKRAATRIIRSVTSCREKAKLPCVCGHRLIDHVIDGKRCYVSNCDCPSFKEKIL